MMTARRRVRGCARLARVQAGLGGARLDAGGQQHMHPTALDTAGNLPDRTASSASPR